MKCFLCELTCEISLRRARLLGPDCFSSFMQGQGTCIIGDRVWSVPVLTDHGLFSPPVSLTIDFETDLSKGHIQTQSARHSRRFSNRQGPDTLEKRREAGVRNRSPFKKALAKAPLFTTTSGDGNIL